MLYNAAKCLKVPVREESQSSVIKTKTNKNPTKTCLIIFNLPTIVICFMVLFLVIITISTFPQDWQEAVAEGEEKRCSKEFSRACQLLSH